MPTDLELLRAALGTTRAELGRLIARISPDTARAVPMLLECRGRVVAIGVGKSGIIARKIAATFVSTGTPSIYVHAGEALHGDVGHIATGDVAIVLSNSGETTEIKELLPHLQRLGVPVVAMTGRASSTLARAAEVVIDTAVESESDPLNAAPMASTTLMLAAGDALAAALMHRRGFTAEDYAALHPGGSIGQRLTCRVVDVMHRGDAMPVCREGTLVRDAIHEITSKRLGLTLVVNGDGALTGIITDGDLRRALGRNGNPLGHAVEDVMTRDPKRIAPSWMAIDALELMESHKITSLPVVDDAHRPAGVVHIHDLVSRGIA